VLGNLEKALDCPLCDAELVAFMQELAGERGAVGRELPGQVVQDERGVASPLADACEGQSELLLFDVAGTDGIASVVCNSQAVELMLVVRIQGEWAVGEGVGRGITSDGFSTRIP
jgi:hypothetical protein